MAFEQDIPVKGSKKAVITRAYCRIDYLRYDVPNRVGLGVGVYDDEAAAHLPVLDAEGAPVLEKGVPVTIASTRNRLDLVDYNLTVDEFGGKSQINAATAYTRLKIREEWVTAKDLL